MQTISIPLDRVIPADVAQGVWLTQYALSKIDKGTLTAGQPIVQQSVIQNRNFLFKYARRPTLYIESTVDLFVAQSK